MFFKGDFFANQSESFTFDAMNRLENITTNAKNEKTVYNKDGGIQSRTQFGDYGYLYTTHKLDNITGSIYAPQQHDLTYAPNGKTQSINTKAHLYEISYNEAAGRIKTILKDKSTNQILKHKIYVGSDYEVETTPAGVRTLHYINSPYGIAAVIERKNNQDQIYYIHTDYQGTWNTISNQAGQVVERNTYDAWGKWQTNIPASTTHLFDYGYTGHEMLWEFGLINMSGRIYDPEIRQFLSPDNFVQSPDYSQNYNRYTYCYNNPLKYTDPSGEIIGISAVVITCMVIGAWQGGSIENGTINPFKWDYNQKTLGAMIIGAAIGGITGAGGYYAGVAASAGLYSATGISGGIIGGAFKGAVTGFTTGYLSGLTMGLWAGKSTKESFHDARKQGVMGAAIGAIAGGIDGGIDAQKAQNNIWTGQRREPMVFRYDKEYPIRAAEHNLMYNRSRSSGLQEGSGRTSYYGKTNNQMGLVSGVDYPSEINITVPDGYHLDRVEVNRFGFQDGQSLNISTESDFISFTDSPGASQYNNISFSDLGKTKYLNIKIDGRVYTQGGAVPPYQIRVGGYRWFPTLHFFGF